MAIGKIQRIQQLNDLLREHSGHTIIELMAKLDVSDRAIRGYLDQIQKPPYNAVFWNEYRGKERLYRYKDVNFSLRLFKDKNEIKAKLDAAISALEQYVGTPQYDWLKLCLIAIENNSMDGIGNVMSFENNAELTGIEYLMDLSDAIVNKYPIRLRYKPYGTEEKYEEVYPYHLKQYNNRWFLIGKAEGKEHLRNYALDRILGVTHLSKAYIETDIDFDEYFDDVIGVSVNNVPVDEIVLMVNKKRYPYIKTKPLHWSQKHNKSKDTEDSVCITLQVKQNKELVSTLMSYAEDVTVLLPETLRETIIHKLRILNKAYNID